MTRDIPRGIRGISDRPRRAPRLGKIKLGRLVTTASGKERPEATDHFVVPDIVAEQYGTAPKSIDIILPSDDVEIFAPYNLKQYGAGTGLKCTGNGELARSLVDPGVFARWSKETGWDEDNPEGTRPEAPPRETLWGGRADTKKEWHLLPCFGLGYEGAAPCPMIENKSCRSVMHLQFIMPKVPGFGVWQMDIGSPISIGNILNFVHFFGSMSGGRYAGVPLRLEMVPIEVAPDGHRRTVHVVELRFDQSFEAIGQLPTNLLEAVTGAPALMLEPPDETDLRTTLPDEDDDIPLDATEFEEVDDTTAIVDDETIKDLGPASDQMVVPDEVRDMSSMLKWAHGTLGLQPAEVFETLGATNGTAILEIYATWRDAAVALLAKLKEQRLQERFFNDPEPGPSPMDGAVEQQEPLPLES